MNPFKCLNGSRFNKLQRFWGDFNHQNNVLKSTQTVAMCVVFNVLNFFHYVQMTKLDFSGYLESSMKLV